MPTVPQFGREEKLNGSPLPYEHYNLNGNMFGQAQAQAIGNVAQGLGDVAKIALDINKKLEETKVVEFNNALESWRQTNLIDKETGYLAKQGSDAAGKSPEVMKSYDDFVTDWMSKNRLSRTNTARINHISSQKRTGILYNATNHDLEQTNKYAATESKLGIHNAIVNAVSERNNPDAIAVQIENVKQHCRWQGEMQKSDEATVNLNIQNNVSELHQAVLDAKIQEGDLTAKEYFEKNKDSINPQLHSKYIGAIKNEEMKYQSREMANDIIANSASEEEAVKKAEAIEDVNMSDAVVSRIKRHYSEQEHFKNQAEREALEGFYNTVINNMQNGGTISYDDIPTNVDPQTKLSLMNYINKNGQPETDNQIWEDLYEMSVNNAQGFVNEDLNKYRGFLSDSEYKQFVKRQEDIKAGKFYTTIKDDNKMIDDALDAMKLKSDKKQASAYSEIRALVREYEARKGRKITDEELMNITNSLNYEGEKGVQLYKQLEKGMAARTGFIRDVINDFAYYQSQHNGQLPNNDEKYKIITNRITQRAQENKTQAQQTVDRFSNNSLTLRNIAYTTAKPNEQKVLTFFADNQIPTIGNQLGMKLTVTSRYRNQAGSHHAEGRAADVSMSEHNAQNRIKIYEKLLALPTVQAIGTSDPNILAHFAGNKKIVDERKYDRQHGTNHVNHAHVTLINYNPATPAGTTKIAAKNGVYSY